MNAWLEKYRLIISILMVSILIIGTIFFLRKNSSSETIQLPTPTPVQSRPKTALRVYIVGAVKNPGVYSFREDDRVENALDAAGGANADADLSQINLAMKLRDEMQITIPTIPTVTVNSIASAPDQTININSASSPELESLPKIGPVTAKRIIDYRQKNGPFRTTKELVDNKLIPQSTYEAIKDLIDAH